MKKITLIALCGLTLGLSACLETPEESETPDVLASYQSVGNALSDAWAADPLSMNQGDFLYIETEQKLESMQPRLVMQEGITLSEKTMSLPEPKKRRWDFKFLYQTAIIQGNETLQSTEEKNRYLVEDIPEENEESNIPAAIAAFSKSLTSSSSPIPTLTGEIDAADGKEDLPLRFNVEKLYDLVAQCAEPDGLDEYCQKEFGAKSCDLYCANLKVTDELRTPPPLMKSQPDCAGIPNCTLNVKVVNFDSVFKLHLSQGIQTQKINYSVALSPDLPFLGRVLDICQRGLIPIENGKVLVNICSKVKNFKRGATP